MYPDDGGLRRGRKGLARRTWPLVFVLGLAASQCDGGCQCGGGASDQLPETPALRLEAYAERLPADVDGAFFVTDVKPARTSLSVLAKQFAGTLPVEAYRQEMVAVTGIDLLDEASLKAGGIHPAGGFAVATWRRAPVVLCYIVDKKKFETNVIGSLTKHYRAKVVKATGDTKVNTLVGRDVQLAWQYTDSGMVVLAGSPVGGTGDAEKTVTEVVTAAAETPLAGSDKFASFRARLGTKWPMAAYLSTAEAASIYQSLVPGLKGYQKEILAAVADNITWTGLGFQADANSVTGTAFVGVATKTLDAFVGLDKPPKKAPNFKVLIQENAYLFMRLSISAEIFWREYQKVLPEKQLRFLKKIFTNVKSSTKVDIEKDLISNLSGQAAVGVYDIDPIKLTARRANERMKVVSFMGHVQVKDAKAFTGFLDGVVAELHGAVRAERIPGGSIRYGFDPNSSTAPPFALYVVDDLVTIASTSIEPTRVASVLTGDGMALVKKAKSALARRVLTEDPSTGLFVSIDRAKTKLKEAGAPEIVGKLLGTADALVVKLSMAQGGIAIDGEISLAGDKTETKASPKATP